MNSKKLFSIYSLLILVLVITAATFVQMAAAQGASEVTYTFTGETLEGPETLKAGYHTITLTNESDKGADLVIIQLDEKGTEENLLAEAQAVDKAFMEEGGDPSAAFRTFLEGRSLWGGPMAKPGTSANIGVDLSAGHYVLMSTSHSEEGPEARPPGYVVKPLEVTGEGAVALNADAVVRMADFAFAIPADLQAGEQTWLFINSGEQVHHAVIQKVKAGKTMDDVTKYAETFEGEDPTEEFAYVNMLSPGSSNYVILDLAPGSYVALCFIPDYAQSGDGAPHMAHGMMQTFTVAGE